MPRIAGSRFVAGASELHDLGLEPLVGLTIPKGLICSFCGKEVEEGQATQGAGKPGKIIKDISTGTDEFRRDIIHVGTKVVGCQSCAHLVVPVYNRFGDLVGKVKFPESKG